MARRRRNTPAGQQEERAPAGFALEPPPDIPLNAVQRMVFDEIMESRIPSAWRKIDLRKAAQWAKLETRINEADGIVDRTGLMVRSRTGRPIPNPLFDLMEKMTRQQLALGRALALTVGMTEIDPNSLNRASLYSSASAQRAASDGNDDRVVLFADRRRVDSV